MPRMNYTLNDNYFNKINSEHKAYFLGFLYADGNVAANSNAISLCINDTWILDQFLNQLELNKPLYKNPNHDLAYTLSFSSPQMKKDLIFLGCRPRKSLTLELPNDDQVPPELFHHFVRGYFDGDGSIYIHPKLKYAQLGIMSSKKFCEQFKAKMKDFNLNFAFDKVKSRAERVRLTSKKQIKIMRDFMYHDSSIYLKRKFLKMEEV
jgi:hypothetical protein